MLERVFPVGTVLRNAEVTGQVSFGRQMGTYHRDTYAASSRDNTAGFLRCTKSDRTPCSDPLTGIGTQMDPRDIQKTCTEGRCRNAVYRDHCEVHRWSHTGRNIHAPSGHLPPYEYMDTPRHAGSSTYPSMITASNVMTGQFEKFAGYHQFPVFDRINIFIVQIESDQLHGTCS